ncbi:hypothetical protein QE450_002288 [Paenibacillus sp. SORGH_AS306]|nr:MULTISPECIES: hypothetical protein [unclassified Paenibacillus]MDQ1234790.1 hypothetical protein [Paenibacillus sp. SORGH_AS_0306]MDR6111837.1 hypothetical protein [Paenibacillus sp. SORGH_AS_0338]
MKQKPGLWWGWQVGSAIEVNQYIGNVKKASESYGIGLEAFLLERM